MIGFISEYRDDWVDLGLPVDVNNITMDYLHSTAEPLEQNTGLYPISEYEFSGSNQVSSTRRPQGIAKYGNIIFNSWYFRSNSDYEDACKLTISDELGHTDICPVQLDENNKFVRVDSHGSAIAILGDYLYLTDEHLSAIRVFCIKDIYQRTNILPAMGDDEFTEFFDWVMPEVGRILVTLPTGTPDILSINNNEFLLGNFYYPPSYPGTDSQLHYLPLDENATYEFGVPEDNPTTILAVYPEGHELEGQVIKQIQGAVKYENDLILNCSWSAEVKQLIVINLQTGGFFTGDTIDGRSHDNTNWLYGCEDLCIDDGRVYTVTEFRHFRSITEWSLWEILNLRTCQAKMTVALNYPNWYLFEGDLDGLDGQPLPSGHIATLSKYDALDQIMNGASFIYTT